MTTSGGRWPCACCGYRTLPEREMYETCPVCGWIDDAAQPWEREGCNGDCLADAQHAYFSVPPEHRHDPAHRRPPLPDEARDPGWRPLERTPELLAAITRAEAEWEAQWRRSVESAGREPDEPDEPDEEVQAHNDALAALRAEAPRLPAEEVEARVRALHPGARFPTVELDRVVAALRDPSHHETGPATG